MKRPHRSSNYQIKPRVRLITSATGLRPYYSCVFRDPCDLMQVRGEPLRWKFQYIGVGYTADEAIRHCQMEYLRKREFNEKSPMVDLLPEQFYGPSGHTRWWQFWRWFR